MFRLAMDTVEQNSEEGQSPENLARSLSDFIYHVLPETRFASDTGAPLGLRPEEAAGDRIYRGILT